MVSHFTIPFYLNITVLFFRDPDPPPLIPIEKAGSVTAGGITRHDVFNQFPAEQSRHVQVSADLFYHVPVAQGGIIRPP